MEVTTGVIDVENSRGKEEKESWINFHNQSI